MEAGAIGVNGLESDDFVVQAMSQYEADQFTLECRLQWTPVGIDSVPFRLTTMMEYTCRSNEGVIQLACCSMPWQDVGNRKMIDVSCAKRRTLEMQCRFAQVVGNRVITHGSNVRYIGLTTSCETIELN